MDRMRAGKFPSFNFIASSALSQAQTAQRGPLDGKEVNSIYEKSAPEGALLRCCGCSGMPVWNGRADQNSTSGTPSPTNPSDCIRVKTAFSNAKRFFNRSTSLIFRANS